MRTLRCQEARDRMFLAVSGELGDAEAAEFYSHLAACSACQEAFSEHVKLNSMFERNMPRLFLMRNEQGYDC